MPSNTLRNHKISTKLTRLSALFAMTIGVFSISTNTQAQGVSFEGERVEVIVPFKEGGGTDTWSRFFAPYLGKALPGQPVVVIKNIPGGGSTKGANQFARRGKDNGLNLLATSASTQFPYLLSDRRVRYDYNDWSVILASSTGGVVYVSPSTGITSAADLVAKKDKVSFKYASQGAASIDLVALLAMDLLDTQVQAVFGMKGRGAGRLAFERGEVNLDSQTSSSYLKKVIPLVEEGKAIPLFSFGILDKNGQLQRDPNFPELPNFAEVYKMAHPDSTVEEGYKVWRKFFIAGYVAQKMFFVPKSTPEDIVQTWRDSATKLVTDPAFLEKAEEVLGNYPQLTNEEAEQALQAVLEVDEKSQEWIRQWLLKNYNAKL